MKWNPLYLSVNVFITKVLIGDTFFYVSYWRRGRHFTWSSEAREGPAAPQRKGSTLISQLFFRLRVLFLHWKSNPRLRSAVKRSTDWANPAAVKMVQIKYPFPRARFPSDTSQCLCSLFIFSRCAYAFSLENFLQGSVFILALDVQRKRGKWISSFLPTALE